MRPRFVTFEGLDGSGKSTHLERAARWLGELGVPLVATREPGGTAIGAAIRKVFLDRGHGGMDPRVELLLVFAARRQHLVEVIEPALAAGRHVLCDRFTDSTVAYQGYGRGVPLEIVAEVERLATGGRRPDLTLLFDLPAAIARRRGHSGHRRRIGRVDRLDAESVAFYDRVRAGYLEIARRESERVVTIDSSRTVAETEDAVRQALASLAPGAP
ncbi:MAG TPA: dTMP kinase [Thermoanaerobaculia bacterium]|nr:dTMP kinase [Thermoanaerobaculia bacterium]